VKTLLKFGNTESLSPSGRLYVSNTSPASPMGMQVLGTPFADSSERSQSGMIHGLENCIPDSINPLVSVTPYFQKSTTALHLSITLKEIKSKEMLNISEAFFAYARSKGSDIALLGNSEKWACDSAGNSPLHIAR
jgi:hypothetical protein